MGVTICSSTTLVAVIWLGAIAQSENISDVDTGWCLRNHYSKHNDVREALSAVLGELTMLERIENVRIQAIKLLNDTDAYEMPAKISDNVVDTMKFFDDLGPLFWDGTLATYMCPVSCAAPHARAGLSVPIPPEPSRGV